MGDRESHFSAAPNFDRSSAMLAFLADHPAVRVADASEPMLGILLREARDLLSIGLTHGFVGRDEIAALSAQLEHGVLCARDASALLTLAREVTDVIAAVIERYVVQDYDHFSSVWNEKQSLSEIHFYRWSAAVLIEFLQASRQRIPSNAQILDIGTGTGYPSFLLAALFPEYQFLATDVSSAQLRQARSMPEAIRSHTSSTSVPAIVREILSSRGAAPPERFAEVRLVQTNSVPLHDSSVDICVMTTSIPSYTPRMGELLADIARALKPNGRALIAFSHLSLPRLILLSRTEGWRRAMTHWARGYHASVIPVKAVAGSHKVTLNYKLSLTRRRINKMLSLAGLRIVRVRAVLPAVYSWLAVARRTRRGDPMPSAFTAIPLTRRGPTPLHHRLLMVADGILSNSTHLGYELWCEVCRDD